LVVQESLEVIDPILDQVEAGRARIDTLAAELKPMIEALNAQLRQAEQSSTRAETSGDRRAPADALDQSSREIFNAVMQRILDNHLVQPPNASQPHYTAPGATRHEFK